MPLDLLAFHKNGGGRAAVHKVNNNLKSSRKVALRIPSPMHSPALVRFFFSYRLAYSTRVCSRHRRLSL